MKIQTRCNQAKYILELDGRLDASWSAYVDANIEAAIQGGHHEIDIDLTKVDYMSSAGIGVLLKYRKKLIGVQGCLRVIHPTENVLSVLRLMRLSELLVGDSGEAVPSTPTQPSLGFEHNGCAASSRMGRYRGHPQRGGFDSLLHDRSCDRRGPTRSPVGFCL
jgi:anti-sigma B factor antagonist